MNPKCRFDVLVAGGGLSGLSAAYLMANAGLKVAVVERGAHPGAKNVMGGILYASPAGLIFPEFWKKAPVERLIMEQNLWVLSKTGALQIGLKNESFAGESPNAFSILRAKFDRWLAKEVTNSGALIIPETVVTDVIEENGNVIGLKTDRDEGDLYANLTIASDGIMSLVARKAGLKKEWTNRELSLVVKEVISLPRKEIEERFRLSEGTGASIEFVGEATSGLMGIAFLYTNKDTLSLGCGTLLSQMIEAGKNPNDLLEHFKSHPSVSPLIRGGEIREYLAHLIPEGGYRAVPKLYKGGLLVTGDAAGLVNSFHREGSNMAMISGKLAAETALEAYKQKDFSQDFLSLYKKKMDESFIMKDLKKYANAGSFFEERPHFFRDYPELAVQSATQFLKSDMVPKRSRQWEILKGVLKTRSLSGMISDALGAARRMF